MVLLVKTYEITYDYDFWWDDWTDNEKRFGLGIGIVPAYEVWEIVSVVQDCFVLEARELKR